MQHRWRRPLLVAEFVSLAILVGSMAWMAGESGNSATPVSVAWLLIPALASLGVFASFTGLMYLRWIAAAEAGHSTRNRLVFGLLALTLLAVWVYAVASTWISLNNAPGF